MTDYIVPRADSIAVEQIPDELKSRDQWVCWRYRDRDGKRAKIPVDPNTENRASTTNYKTWSSFETALSCYGRRKDEVDGVGFVFTASDPLVGVDIDDCIDPGGNLDPTATAIVDQLSSYTESSPSGRGLHVILNGSLPDDANRRDNVEIYDQDRFFTVTGHHIAGTPSTIERRQGAIESIHSEYILTSSDSGIITGGGEDSPSPPVLSDDALIEKAKRAKKGDLFSRLWRGNTDSFDSHSEADEALCCRLAFWTGGNCTQIDRLFRQSGLIREKWDEQRGDRTYGDLTIDSAVSMVDNHYEPDFAEQSQTDNNPNKTTIGDVKEVVTTEFDDRTWDVTEAALSAHVTLLLKDQTGGIGLVITGPSGSGKTTVLKFFEGLDEMIYRSDDVTPASFVSADSSKNEEQLKDIDLLPRVSQKTLLSRDMATWFAGEQEAVYKRMSIMAPLMDGDGYTRDSGSHGQRGYTGSDYRFNFIGATTPLSPRAWKVMGTVGNRLVFHEKTSTTDTSSIIEDVVEGSNYAESVDRCRSVVQDLLSKLWDSSGGVGSLELGSSSDPDVESALEYLTKLIQFARAPLVDDTPQREGAHRIAHTLWSVARGHALLDNRQQVTIGDMAVCGRIALSTMPTDRRPVIQSLLHPRNGGELIAADVEETANVSRPTAIKRMEALETLGMAASVKTESDEQDRKVVQVKDSFRWPEILDFPSF